MPSTLRRFSSAFVVASCLVAARLPAADGHYDPQSPPVVVAPQTLDLDVEDAARHRTLPIRVFLPAERTAAPVILFSPGLGGSREGYAYLGQHWAARGYVVVVLQHPGSDASVWRDAKPTERLAALRRAASVENFRLRAGDVPAVLDQLGRWSASGDHPLAGRVDVSRVGMAGHSFGAVTTQAVSGESFRLVGTSLTDARIRAAVMLSPSAPRKGADPGRAFSGVALPWLLMTGTKDVSPIGDIDVASRLSVYPALPAGGKYELVLDGAEHSAFSDRALPGDSAQRNPNHQRAIAALSTAFWDAWLRDDAAAKTWLDGDGPRSVLEASDRWQRK